MIPITLFFVLITSFVSREAAPVDLPTALERGWVNVTASGAGGYGERSLQLQLTNTHRRPWKLQVPAGLLFHSQDSSEQDLVVAQTRLLAMERGKNRRLTLDGLCTQAQNAAPGEGSDFLLGAAATGPLAEVIRYIDEQRTSPDIAQDAVWAVTDDHPLEHIQDPGLARFTAQALGKEPPAYTIYNNGVRRQRPGAPAYHYEPTRISGLFTFATDQDLAASFGLYNEAGEEILNLFRGRPHRRGQHRFRFQFEVRNLPRGNYSARLVSEGEVLGEMAVRW